MASALPDVFRKRRALGRLNVVGVGLSLASVVGALYGFSWVFALPTLFVGMAWAALLRWPKTFRNERLRVGWVASVPFGVLNAALVGAMICVGDAAPASGWMEHVWTAWFGALLGVTLGAIVWIPAVLATLLLFGVPIAWSQRLARRGLAGEERGERIVAVVYALLGLLAPVRLVERHLAGTSPLPYDGWSGLAIASAGALAVALGLFAVVVATARGRLRRTFVAGVERGDHPGYRIEEKEEGKILVRVESQGHAYRVVDFEEVLVELDEDGSARRVLTAEDGLRNA